MVLAFGLQRLAMTCLEYGDPQRLRRRGYSYYDAVTEEVVRLHSAEAYSDIHCRQWLSAMDSYETDQSQRTIDPDYPKSESYNRGSVGKGQYAMAPMGR